MSFKGDPVRLLVIPGLNDSGPAHWQTWLQGQYGRRAVRVEQDDWARADLARWSQRIASTLALDPDARWIAVAHSFGCLALLRTLLSQDSQQPGSVQAALLVAPADPEKFGVSAKLPQSLLHIPTTVLASESDPWMPFDSASAWAHVWGARLLSLGNAGHINTESGFGPLPSAKAWVEQATRHLERGRRIDRAHPLELSFAI